MRIAVSKGRGRAKSSEWWCGCGSREGRRECSWQMPASHTHLSWRRGSRVLLGEAVVKVRRDQDQAWRFNGGWGRIRTGRTKQRIMLIQ
jgi:hypothetical protein